jgi:hypothetical protein
MIPRILNLQGLIGIAASVLLLILVFVKVGEVRHWRKQSAHFELLYLGEQSAGARTIANYRAATEAARAADQANAERVAAGQRLISERTSNDLEARLADARARALRLQLDSRPPAAAGGARRAAPLPAARTAPGAPRASAEEDGLSLADRLIATEQAIQLDELIKWVTAQETVAVSEPAK